MESNKDVPVQIRKRAWVYVILGFLAVAYSVQAMSLVGLGWILALCCAYGAFMAGNGVLMLKGGGIDFLFERAPLAEAAARARIQGKRSGE